MSPSRTSSSSSLGHAFIVTLDGPAASGKTSVSREIARRFGWNWVSTGAFYRGLALVASREGADFGNERALAALAEAPSWSVRMAPEMTRVFHGETDVTEEVGREDVGTMASKISSFPLVRRALLQAQRSCADGAKGLVAEGRDCGTVVFPAAQVKIFLTARAEDRAARRARDEGLSVDQTQVAQQERDAQDATRKTAPMQAPPDSYLVDASALGFEAVVEAVEALILKAKPPRGPVGAVR